MLRHPQSYAHSLASHRYLTPRRRVFLSPPRPAPPRHIAPRRCHPTASPCAIPARRQQLVPAPGGGGGGGGRGEGRRDAVWAEEAERVGAEAEPRQQVLGPARLSAETGASLARRRCLCVIKDTELANEAGASLARRRGSGCPVPHIHGLWPLVLAVHVTTAPAFASAGFGQL